MAMTKTGFMRGMQCPKMLWLDRHKPELQIVAPEIQKRLDNGNTFGDLARGMFGSYEEMTVFKPGTMTPDIQEMLSRTEHHLSIGTPVICEAAFSNYNNYYNTFYITTLFSNVSKTTSSLLSISSNFHFQ